MAQRRNGAGGRGDCRRATRARTRRRQGRLVRVIESRFGRSTGIAGMTTPAYRCNDRHAMSITYLEAIREAQAKLLRDDGRVFIYGQDVGGTFGGAFKATKGLAKEFP